MPTPVHTIVAVAVPTANVLTLHSAPFQLVAGTGGNLFNLNSVYIKYVAGATPFTVNANDVLTVYTGSGTVLSAYPGTLFNAAGFVDQAANRGGFFDGWFTGIDVQANVNNSAPASSIVGAGLYLTQFTSGSFPAGADWTNGNGSLLVTVEYSYLLA
jgi:hypothetical protein